jgi:hypothetical protein
VNRFGHGGLCELKLLGRFAEMQLRSDCQEAINLPQVHGAFLSLSIGQSDRKEEYARRSACAI